MAEAGTSNRSRGRHDTAHAQDFVLAGRFKCCGGQHVDIESLTQRIENFHRIAGFAIGSFQFLHHGHQIPALKAEVGEVDGNHRVFIEFKFNDNFRCGDGMRVINRNNPDKGSFSQIVRTEREMFDGPWSVPETSKVSPNWELRAGVASRGRICERMSSISRWGFSEV